MEVLRYRCSTCGEEHEGLPDLAFGSPLYYGQVPEAERSTRAVLTSDTCVIDNEDYFVRACLEVPIRGTRSTFVWGVWVSLSERNFRRYLELFQKDPPPDEGPYFGWLSNQLPGYEETFRLKTLVHLRPQGQRPTVELEPTDHPLAVHQQQGIPLLDLLDMIGDRLHEPVACSGGDG